MSTKWSNKLIIGLTGNIATGKSAVLSFAAEQGALVIDADKVAHAVMDNNQEVKHGIAEAFGKTVFNPDGSVNRPALGQVVFKDAAALEKLERIVHPYVRTQIHQQIEQGSQSMVVIEAIKLLEGGLAEECNHIWVTTCSRFLQLQRLIIGRGMDEEHAFERVLMQHPQADKVSRANVVINTQGTMAETHNQVMAAWHGLMFDAATGTPVEPKPEAMQVEAAVSTPPEPKAEPKPEPKVEAAVPAVVSTEAEAEPGKVVVRRARPSDIPSIMLLINKATNGKVKPKRAEILMSLSERGYLIGQNDIAITTVVGWYTDKGFAVIEQMYIHPESEVDVTGQAVLAEIGKTANELMCEAVFAYFTEETISDTAVQVLTNYKYEKVDSAADWPRVWQAALKESRPAGSIAYVRKLWTARVA